VTEDECYREFVETLRGQPAYVSPPAAVAAVPAVLPGGQEQRDRDFNFALECVLAGMAAMRDRVAEQVRPTTTPA
jgi:hypothetical protein